MTTYDGTTALITGASSGIGAEFATRIAERGADVVLVARRADRLRALADELSARTGVRATPIALDLAAPDAAARLRAELRSREITVQTLVNNAGFGGIGAFRDTDPERIDEMIRLNVSSLVSITREFLPDLVSAGSGALVNVASVVAYQPCPNMAVYGATKAFVLSFTEAIAQETRDSGVSVLALSPGATQTDFFDIAGDTRARVGRRDSPGRVVDRALRALDRRHTPPSVVVGALNSAMSTVARVLPRRLTLALSARVLG